jgi:hypothetical protein
MSKTFTIKTEDDEIRLLLNESNNSWNQIKGKDCFIAIEEGEIDEANNNFILKGRLGASVSKVIILHDFSWGDTEVGDTGKFEGLLLSCYPKEWECVSVT